MSKYKCIYDMNRQCIHIPNGVGCSKLCYDSYQQGRADAINDVLDIIGFRNLDDISQRYIYAKKLIDDIYKLRDS